jgi:hypothetical protein
MNIMRTIRTCFLAYLFAAFPLSGARSADHTIKAGSINVTVYVYVPPTADGTGGLGSASYVRPGASPVSFLSTELGAINSAHEDGKWKLVSGDIGAVFRLDLPDAAVEAGAKSVDVVVHEGGGHVGHVTIDLVGYDPTAANLPANVTQISGDETAADNAELFFDGTGYGPLVHRTVMAAADIQEPASFTLLTGSATNDAYVGCRVVVTNDLNLAEKRTALVTDYVGATKVLSVDWGGVPPLLAEGHFVDILPPGFASADRLKLAAVHTKLPAKSFLTGTNNADGDMQMNEATGNFPGTVGSINGTTFESIHLDHLFASADPGSAVANDSFWAKLLSKSATAAYTDYNNTTDSLQAQRENFDSVLDGAPTFSQAMDAQGYTMALAQKLERVGPTLLVSTTIDGAPASQTQFVLAAGPPDDDALNGALVIVTNGSQKAVGIVRDYIGASKTVTLVTDPQIYTMGSGNQVDIIAGGPVPLWLGASP